MPTAQAEITAIGITELDADGFPFARHWGDTQAIVFRHDWRGENPDPSRQTEVRLLWNDDALFVRFRCCYRSLTVFEDAAGDGRHEHLWERDVAEVFLQPDCFGSRHYKEFEVAPNGMWLDLEITPAGLQHLRSGMRSTTTIREPRHEWTAILALPFAALVSQFDPAQNWRVNFFRCEGVVPERFYSAWRPTCTAEPQFHVPEAFGTLIWQP